MNRRLFIILFIISLFVCGCKKKHKVFLPEYSTIDKVALLEMHNEKREENKVRPLKLQIELDEAAENHALWMAKNNRLSHTEGWSGGVENRLKKQFTIVGENIAWNQRSPAEVMMAWMKSPGHRENILNKHFKLVGFAVVENAYGEPYWCAVFSD